MSSFTRKLMQCDKLHTLHTLLYEQKLQYVLPYTLKQPQYDLDVTADMFYTDLMRQVVPMELLYNPDHSALESISAYYQTHLSSMTKAIQNWKTLDSTALPYWDGLFKSLAIDLSMYNGQTLDAWKLIPGVTDDMRLFAPTSSVSTHVIHRNANTETLFVVGELYDLLDSIDFGEATCIARDVGFKTTVVELLLEHWLAAYMLLANARPEWITCECADLILESLDDTYFQNAMEEWYPCDTTIQLDNGIQVAMSESIANWLQHGTDLFLTMAGALMWRWGENMASYIYRNGLCQLWQDGVDSNTSVSFWGIARMLPNQIVLFEDHIQELLVALMSADYFATMDGLAEIPVPCLSRNNGVFRPLPHYDVHNVNRST